MPDFIVNVVIDESEVSREIPVEVSSELTLRAFLKKMAEEYNVAIRHCSIFYSNKDKRILHLTLAHLDTKLYDIYIEKNPSHLHPREIRLLALTTLRFVEKSERDLSSKSIFEFDKFKEMKNMRDMRADDIHAALHAHLEIGDLRKIVMEYYNPNPDFLYETIGFDKAQAQWNSELARLDSVPANWRELSPQEKNKILPEEELQGLADWITLPENQRAPNALMQQAIIDNDILKFKLARYLGASWPKISLLIEHERVAMLAVMMQEVKINLETCFKFLSDAAGKHRINRFDRLRNDRLHEIIKILATYPGMPGYVNSKGDTVLNKLCDKGEFSPNVIKAILEDSSKLVNQVDPLRKFSPLHNAVDVHNVEIVERLLSVPGIKVNLVNHLGQTPLHHAVWHSNVELVKLLLSVPGIKVNLVNCVGETPLMTAQRKRDGDIIKLLEEHIKTKQATMQAKWFCVFKPAAKMQSSDILQLKNNLHEILSLNKYIQSDISGKTQIVIDLGDITVAGPIDEKGAGEMQKHCLDSFTKLLVNHMGLKDVIVEFNQEGQLLIQGITAEKLSELTVDAPTQSSSKGLG